MVATSADLIETARSLVPALRQLRDECDRSGRTPPDAVRLLGDAGLFRMWLPAALGGLEATPAVFYQAIAEVASADGSIGWNLMNGACCGLMGFYLPPDVGRQVYGDDGSAIVAGQIAPNGRAEPVDGGYRVGGNWSFGSGIHHAAWIASGCLVAGEDGAPPQRIHVMTPASDVTIDEDSWHVSGLRGTGSCDYAMDGVFVPQERAFSFFVSRTFHAAPHAHLPRTAFAMSVGAVTLGIARAAIDALVELAAVKRAPGAPTLLREMPATQVAIGEAEALVGAARAYMLETAARVWDACARGEPAGVEARLRLRAASVAVPRMCAQAVDLCWNAAGAAALRESYEIERCFRDVHAATQHLGVSPPMLQDTGRALLGLEPQIVPF